MGPVVTVRYLLARGKSTALRMAMPPLETLTLGADPKCDVVIDEPGVAPSHLEIYLDHGVGIRANHADTARLLGDRESAIETGRTIDLDEGDRIRVGTVELTFVSAANDGVRASHVVTRSYLERCAADVETSGVVAWLRISNGPADDGLGAVVASKARADVVVAMLSSREVGLFVPDVSEVGAQDVLAPIITHLYETGADVLVGVAHTDEGLRAQLLETASQRTARPSHTGGDGPKQLITRDPSMGKVVELVERVAKSTTPVLILGETGVGKDLVAQIIHEGSDRASRAFIRVSCVDLSDLFVDEANTNFLARAKGGTVHLDELAGLSDRAQLSLGSLLDDAYGASLDIRVIASSNHDLAAKVKDGSFRKDLFFRLNRLTIEVPPLRERSADIVPLAEHFIETSPHLRARDVTPVLTESAKSKLIGHRWPGNVRELKNALERAMLLTSGDKLDVDHFTTDIAGAETDPLAAPPLQDGERLSLKDEIAALEKRRIIEALERYPTQRDAAAALDMPMRTFLNRLDAFGIQRARGGGKKSD